MTKIMGFLLIVSAFFLMGKKLSEIKRQRLAFLQSMLNAISQFKTAILLFKTPLPYALEKSRIKENALLLGSNFLTEEDENDYNTFIKGLSSESMEGQLSNAEAYYLRVSEEEKAERAEYKKASKLISGGSILLGVLLGIILI